LNAGRLDVHRSLLASNGGAGINLNQNTTNYDRFILSMTLCNITGHFDNSAIVTTIDMHNIEINMDSCSFWDNYNGAIAIASIDNGDIRIMNGNFTRNRGTVVSIGQFDSIASTLLVDASIFTLNQLNSHEHQQSVIDVEIDPNNHNKGIKCNRDGTHLNAFR